MDTHDIKQITIDDIAKYIEQSNYGPALFDILYSIPKKPDRADAVKLCERVSAISARCVSRLKRVQHENI